MHLRYVRDDEVTEAGKAPGPTPTPVGVACWMIAIFIITLALLT